MQDCPFIPLSDWTAIKKGPYTIILANTICKRLQGLQCIKKLPRDTLALFKNISAGTYFHTRNCLFSIDIVPLSNTGEVLRMWTVNPNNNNIGPMPYFTSKVLEAPAGWFRNKNIKVGDFLPLLNL